jgi:hypothetical protein
MLRLIGFIVVALLLLGPLLLHAGLLAHVPLLREFVLFEMQVFDTLVAEVRRLFNSRT